MPLTGPGTGTPSPQKYLKTEAAAFGGESSSAHKLTPGKAAGEGKRCHRATAWPDNGSKSRH